MNDALLLEDLSLKIPKLQENNGFVPFILKRFELI